MLLRAKRRPHRRTKTVRGLQVCIFVTLFTNTAPNLQHLQPLHPGCCVGRMLEAHGVCGLHVKDTPRPHVKDTQRSNLPRKPQTTDIY
jgi:hypothetical protein